MCGMREGRQGGWWSDLAEGVEAIRWFCPDAASYVMGGTLPVDVGYIFPKCIILKADRADTFSPSPSKMERGPGGEASQLHRPFHMRHSTPDYRRGQVILH